MTASSSPIRPDVFDPVFPWAKHLDPNSIDDFIRALRDALEEPNPLAAIDHLAVDWAAEAEYERRMNALPEGGVR